MKKKSNLLKGFLATASLCGTLLSGLNAEADLVVTTGIVDANLNNGVGFVGGIFNNNDTVQVATSLLGVKILANKPNFVIAEINTLAPGLAFGGVELSASGSLGPLNAAINLNPNFGPLKFTANGITNIITGVGNQTFSLIDFNGKNSTLQINDGLAITTVIDNTGTTGNGTLNLGNGVSTTDIGSSNSLLAVNINGNGNTTLGGVVKANTITVTNAAANATATGLVTTNLLKYTAAGGIFTAKAGLKGNLDFNNNNGTFNLSNGMSITGNVSSTNGINGILNAAGGTVTGTIDNLNLLQCSAGNGQTLDLQGNAVINNITFAANAAASGTIRIGGGLTLNNNLTFNNGNAAGGILQVDAASTINAAILNGIKATIQINANLTINHPSAGDVNIIRIADGKTYTIDAKNGNVSLLNNEAQIIFEGSTSELDLCKTLHLT